MKRGPLVAAAPAASSNSASTFGWDTVFAVPVSRVNASIAKQKSSPPRLAYKSSLPSQFQMQADFGDWTLIPEGDGAIVRMALPMRNLSGSYISHGTTFHFSCAALVGVIEIKLQFFEHDGKTDLIGPDGKPLPPPAPGTTRHKLMARSTSVDPADPVASLVVMNFTQPLSSPSARIQIEAAFEEWCNAHLGDFAHILAIADINDKVATGAWAFCKPYKTDYAVVDKMDKSASFLGVLCMTSTDPKPDQQQLSAFAVPDNCEAAFLISPKRVLKDILLPSMTGVWPNLDANDIEIASNDQILQLKSGKSFNLPDFVKDGDTYTPVVTSFSLEIMVDEFKVDTHTEVEVSPGIYATCTATYWYKVGLGKNQNGDECLTFSESRPPDKTPGSRADPWVQGLQKAMQVITVVLTVLLFVVDPAIGVLVGVLLTGIAVGEYEINSIQRNAKGDAPGLDDLKQNFTAPIIWSDSKDLDLKTAGLSNCLQLGGVWGN